MHRFYCMHGSTPSPVAPRLKKAPDARHPLPQGGDGKKLQGEGKELTTTDQHSLGPIPLGLPALAPSRKCPNSSGTAEAVP